MSNRRFSLSVLHMLLFSLLTVGMTFGPAHARGGPAVSLPSDQAMPRLVQNHGSYQLVVDGAPFLILGGELENSTASDRRFLGQYWNKLAGMGLNTVIAPVSWELIEPQEGVFDFSSVDFLLADARQHHMRLVLLWFGSWKNSMSSYVPAWVKRDPVRFLRSRDTNGTPLEILSPTSANALAADSAAFRALMAHLKQVDGKQHSVLMVQVENEVGMLPDARDHSADADVAFAAPVPRALTDYLAAHRDTLTPSLKAVWEAHGSKTGASWAETFGAGIETDEIFNAWCQALYTGKVAAAGKAVYPLPTFVNAALIRPGRKPGEYPSGGPLPHLYEVWRAAAPVIDMLSPDLYFPNFVEWAGQYVRPDNPFFIPETGRVNAEEMAANAFYAFGHLNAIGFSPYAPEYFGDKDAASLGAGYGVLQQLAPLILKAQGTGKILGIRAPTNFDGVTDLAPQNVPLGGYRFKILSTEPPPTSVGAKPAETKPGAHGGLIIQTGPDDFVIAGTGLIFYATVSDTSGDVVGFDRVEEGRFVGGHWLAGRRINGDLTNQARFIRLPVNQFGVLYVHLYRYH